MTMNVYHYNCNKQMAKRNNDNMYEVEVDNITKVKKHVSDEEKDKRQGIENMVRGDTCL